MQNSLPKKPTQPVQRRIAYDFEEEIQKFPREVRSKYKDEFKELCNYSIADKDGRFAREGGPFPLNLPAEVFKAYLLYLRQHLLTHSDALPVVFSSHNATSGLMLMRIAMLSILSEGGNPAIQGVNHGEPGYVGLNALEREILDSADPLKDYPLFLKLAENGGPEFSRLASKLLFILRTGNFQVPIEEMQQREVAIDLSLKLAGIGKEKLMDDIESRLDLNVSTDIEGKIIHDSNRPKDIFKILAKSKAGNEFPGADTINEKAVSKYWTLPGAMQHMLEKVVFYDADDGKNIDLADVLIMLTPDFLKRNPNILKDLIGELLNNNYETFQNACVLCATLIERENGWGDVAKAVSAALFTNREDCFDPNRLFALRSIISVITPEKAPVFFQKCFAENSFFIGVTPDERIKLARMLDMNVGEKDETKQVKGFGEYFAELKIDGSLENRNIKELVEYILSNRSIMLSGDGKILTINSDDSPLADNFSEIRFTLNKETRKNPRSLACNIALKLKPDGGAWYCSIDADNNLHWRINREGKFETITLEQFVDGMPITVRPNGETNKEILDEINYLILKKLGELFVRKPMTVTEDVIVESSSEEIPDKSESTPPESGQVVVEGISEAGVREEKPGVVDLADQFAEATRMAHQDLKSGSEDEKKAARHMKMKIGANRELALKIFGKALAKSLMNSTNASKIQKLELPKEVPENLSDLILYTPVPMDGETYYENLDPLAAYEALRDGTKTIEEIFVRSTSAHSKSLPYLKIEPPAVLSKREIERLNYFLEANADAGVSAGETRLLNETVTQAKPNTVKMPLRLNAFASSRENIDINLGPKEKVLYFDVDDFAENRILFEKLKTITKEEIQADVRREMERDLGEKLREAKLRLVNPKLNGAEYLAGVEAYEAEKVKLEKECAIEIDKKVEKELEIQSKLTTVVQKNGEDKKFVKLRLPAIYNFNQTFNQGQFQSLAQLFESLDPEAKKKYD